MNNLKVWIAARLARDARLCHKWWSMRLAIFWSLVSGFVLVAPLVSDEAKEAVGAAPFAIGLFLAASSIGIARVMGQPGVDQ